jgi:hypothetical protein
LQGSVQDELKWALSKSWGSCGSNFFDVYETRLSDGQGWQRQLCREQGQPTDSVFSTRDDMCWPWLYSSLLCKCLKFKRRRIVRTTTGPTGPDTSIKDNIQ